MTGAQRLDYVRTGRRPMFAVRIVITDHNDNGTSYERVYVRDTKSHMTDSEFRAWALGDLSILLDLDGNCTSWTIDDV